MVDIARPASVARNKRIRRFVYFGVALIAIVVVFAATSRLKQAAPPVDWSTLWPDMVKRGPMVRQVRGLGTLVPEEISWIPATTEGRVERILLHPGTRVKADSIILELSNPEVQQRAAEAESQLRAAEAQLINLRVQLRNALLAQQAMFASVQADYQQAKLQAEADAQLAKEGLVSSLTTNLSKVKADQLAGRQEIEQKRLGSLTEANNAQIAVQQAEVDRLRTLSRLRRDQMNALHVRAGIPGMLQLVPVEVGARVAPGTNLARVANPQRLKAELKIPETQAKDVELGQLASIDTRNGIIPGRVSRIDPAAQNGTRTVDVALQGELPRGAVPDLSVDGTIELERLIDVVYVGRPAYGQDQNVIGLFRVDPDGHGAQRVNVKLGRTSVSTVEILSGLKPGDQVILSDMSAYDSYDRVQLTGRRPG